MSLLGSQVCNHVRCNSTFGGNVTELLWLCDSVLFSCPMGNDRDRLVPSMLALNESSVADATRYEEGFIPAKLVSWGGQNEFAEGMTFDCCASWTACGSS
eukprot:6477494-Amphidinium_carterae.1